VKRLVLLRHAKSSWDDPTLRDRDRPLRARDGRGRREQLRAIDLELVRTRRDRGAAELGEADRAVDEDDRLGRELLVRDTERAQVAEAGPAAQEERVVVERTSPQRSWAKTAMVIGGSSAAGAGVGGLMGGKRGALVGAAIGGGAASIYEASRRR